MNGRRNIFTIPRESFRRDNNYLAYVQWHAIALFFAALDLHAPQLCKRSRDMYRDRRTGAHTR